ncbi:MAG: hypothetical protein IPK80_02770 [Nannocystis sp.]|nr:hypothetical protein [Nannocystis sp.]
MSTTERMASDDSRSAPHMRATSVTSHELIVLPSGWAGKYARFESVAGSGSAVDIGIRFGDATAAVVLTDRSAIDGSGNLTADVNAPHLYLRAGEEQRVRIPADATHFSHIGTATTGRIRFGLATGTG